MKLESMALNAEALLEEGGGDDFVLRVQALIVSGTFFDLFTRK